jgi:hypothetical protein
MDQTLNWNDAQALIGNINAESGSRRTIAFGYIINSLLGFEKTERYFRHFSEANKLNKIRQKVWDAFPELHQGYNNNESQLQKLLSKQRSKE